MTGTSAGGGSNPLQSDGELSSMMTKLDAVSDVEEFKRWRSNFVERLEEFLDDDGEGDKAREADAAVQKKMPKVDAAIAKMEGAIDDEGKLSSGVKAQMGMSKLKEACQDLEKRLDNLIPSNSVEAEKCGYSKWNLGAVLVQDGFVIYKDMMHHDTLLSALVKILEEAQVDRQIIDAINYYIKRIHTCLDILADLGLMKVMEKTQEFIPDEKERKGSKLAPQSNGAAAPGTASGAASGAPATASGAPGATDTAPANGEAPTKAIGGAPSPRGPELNDAASVPGPNDAGEGTPTASPANGEAPSNEEDPTAPDESGPTPTGDTPARKKSAQDIIKSQERRQTVTITTRNSMADGPGGKMGLRGGKRPGTVKRAKSFDPSYELEPRVAKPKAKAILPGSSRGGGRGRGVGRTLSKEEAKEKPIANPYDKKKKKKPPQRSNTAPMLRTKKMGEEEEDPKEPDDGEPDGDQEKGKGKLPQKKGGGPDSNQKTKGRPAPAKQQSQAGKKTTTTEAGPEFDTPGSSTPGSVQTTSQPAPKDNKVKVFVYPMKGICSEEKIQLMVDPNKDTITEVKALLKPKTNMEPENQRISGKWSGLHYENEDKPLKFFGIKEDTELDLDPMTIQIQAKIVPQDGKKIPVTVTVADTMNVVKEKIAKETSLEPAQQELYYNDKELTNKDLKKTVKLMGMQEGSMLTVELFQKVPITIKTVIGEQRSIELEVNLKKETLAHIRKQLEEETGIPEDNQVLFMPESTELIEKKKKKVLREHGIESGSVLFVEPRILKVTVVVVGGKKTPLRVTPNSDMGEIIRALIKTGMAVNKSAKPSLKFNGEEFPMGKTVKDMGLQEGSDVILDLNEE